MSLAPIDMLKRCREVFTSYAGEHSAKAKDFHNPPAYRERAAQRAAVNQGIVDEIDADVS